MLSNCGSDEYGGASGGKAGDQTGREYRVIPWYYGNWTTVFRHPNPQARNLIARLAIQAANNDNIGYDQSQRLTFWYRLQAAKFDPSKITTPCESDCSASTAAVCKAVGYLLGISGLKNIWEGMSTWVEVETLRAAGFQVLTASKYLTSEANLLPGDVLLKYGHTAIEVGSGRLSDFPMEVDMPLDNNDINNIWNHDNAGQKLTATNDNVAGISGKLDSVLARLNYSTPIMPFGGTMYRLISTANGGAHRWTNSETERDALISQGWTLEGETFTLGQAGDPVWALINPYTGDTILTTNMAEAEDMAKAGWRSFGIVGTTGDGPEVHRLYNAENGMHMFTTDANEVNVLHSAGWADEQGGFRAA